MAKPKPIDPGIAAVFVRCEDCPPTHEEPCESCAGTGQLVEPNEDFGTQLPLSILYRLIAWERGDKSLPPSVDAALGAAAEAIEGHWSDLACQDSERRYDRD